MVAPDELKLKVVSCDRIGQCLAGLTSQLALEQ